jgi:hypothetical protein
MKRQALFLSVFTAAMLALPAFGADGAPGMMEFRWGKNAFNFEPMPSGPQPLRNLSRRPDGTANAGQLVGDYHNPILTPEAAAVVKQKGELAIAGKGFPNSQDQCRPIAPPFTFAMQLGFAMLPAKGGDISIIYDQNANVRHIHMNAAHPAKPVPSAMGDSVGHWEGDTLVVETTNLNNKTGTGGGYFSDAAILTEKFRRIAKDELSYDLTVNDPKTWTKPFTIHMPYKEDRNYTIYEYACHEGNYSLSNLLRGYRASERDY